MHKIKHFKINTFSLLTKRLIISLLFFACFTPTVFSQGYLVIGFVTDYKSGEVIDSALIVTNYQSTRIPTDEFGYYKIQMERGNNVLSVMHHDYLTETVYLNVRRDTVVNITLKKEILLETIEVSANSISSIINNTQMSTFALPTKEVEALPSLLGETDIIKSTQLTTGVQSGNEGSTGFYVRGGGPDQNLVLMDGIPLYSINHMLGLYSVFNTDAVSSVNLYKGGFPARYGGRLSSVLDIRLKEGDMEKYHGNVSLGLIFSKINLEGPILKNKVSFNISARRTYADILYKAIQKPANLPENNGQIFFYDYNAKLTIKLSKKSKLILGAFKGLDETAINLSDQFTHKNVSYNETNDLNMNWINFTTYIKLKKTYSSKFMSDLLFAYNHYSFNLDYNYYLETEEERQVNNFDFAYQSGIKDFHFTNNYNYTPNNKHYIKFGFNLTAQFFRPKGENYTNVGLSDGQLTIDLTNTLGKGYIYIEDEIQLSEKLNANLGLHLSGLLAEDKLYYDLEPRISLRYLLNDNISFKSSFTRMNQNIHLLSTSTISSPIDLWVPVTKKVKPQRSLQTALGLTIGISNSYELGVESYYKDIDGVIEYKEGETFVGSTLGWEDRIELGKGYSYGAELLLRKTKGKTTGWLGYTLSWSNRVFENINNGEPFPYRYDRRHDLNIVILHNFNKNINAAITWIYGTGNAVSLNSMQFTAQDYPHSFFEDEGVVKYFNGRNNYRMPAYHRLDISFNLKKQKKHGVRTWKIGLYNAYNHQNPFFLFFGYDDSQKVESVGADGEIVYNSKKVLKQFSLLPILPSISYSYRF